MRFEPVELYLESSLFLLKARLCYDRTNVQRQRGDGHVSLSLFLFFFAHILQDYLNFYSAVFTYRCWCVRERCPGGRRAALRCATLRCATLRCGAASVLLLLQLRVYLQRVTLMQRNDYF